MSNVVILAFAYSTGFLTGIGVRIDDWKDAVAHWTIRFVTMLVAGLVIDALWR